MKRIHYILLILVLGACSEEFHEDARDMVALQLQTPIIVTEGATRVRPIEGKTFSYQNTLTYGFDPLSITSIIQVKADRQSLSYCLRKTV